MKLFSKKVMGLCLLLIGFVANAKEYYIQGTLEGTFVDGKYVTKLLNPIGNGIDFSYEPEVLGEEAEKGQYSFRFRNATTECSNGFAKGLSFYKKENGKWQKDSEVSNGVAQFRSDHSMAIVLVLDYSGSLGNDYLKVQESAIEFVNLLSEKTGNRGNVHIGIVAFNYTYTLFDMVPLTNENLARVKSFIRSLKIDNNTALYGAIDLGVEMMDRYVSLNNLEKFDGASLVVFTDGLDNASLKAEKNISTPSQYLEYLIPIVSSKYINGKKMESYIVAVKGKDVKDDDTKTFYENLKSLATSTNHFYLADNMTSLKTEFLLIADGLVTRWQDLICYIPPTGQGEVRWVLECGSEPAPIIVDRPAPKKKVISEIGGIVGGINGFSSKFINRKFAYQLDLGIQLFYINFDIEQNFMYQNYIHEWNPGSLSWFVGGGVSLGWNLLYGGTKFGVNTIGGVEYRFNKIPLALQADFRPGYGLIFEYGGVFEWTIGLSARYYF